MTKKLPKISVITPTLNQGNFIEKTILSVLSQNYPNLEYIIMDGVSVDNTLSILKKYKKKLIYFSDKDKGQSDAINKGIKISTGEIICYLNSDDYLHPNSLKKVANYFLNNKEICWLTGKCLIVDENGIEVRKIITIYKNLFLKFLRFKGIFTVIQFISQPATFWRKDVIKNVGLFDINLNYDMDYDYWLRIWQKYPLYFLDDYLASYRVHGNAKALLSPETQFRIQYHIALKYQKNKLIRLLHLIHAQISLYIYKLFFVKSK